MKRSTLINLIVTLISIFAVLLTAEIIMRFAWKMGGWVERPIYQRSFNPYLRYELVPGENFSATSINADGFRGRDYQVPKGPETFRIIMVGDSETLSVKLPDKDTLPYQLQELLNQNSEGINYEVLNFGVEGYCTFQELEMLKTKGLKYEPDLIILNYVLNDPEPGEYYFQKNFFIRHSALVRYFTFRIKKRLIKKERKALGIDTEIDNYYYYHQPKYFDRVKDAILEMSEIAGDSNHKLLVVIFPTSSIMVKDFRANYPYWPLHELVRGIKSKNMATIDLLDEFNRLNLTPQEVSIDYEYDESHKNPHALGVAAEYIYRTMKKERLIP